VYNRAFGRRRSRGLGALGRRVPNRKHGPRTWCCAVLVLCGCAAAEEPCAPHVEEHARWASATFRPHTDAFLDCPVPEVTYRQVVGDWLRGRGEAAPPVTSVALGRAVHFPWISRYLVRAALSSARWDAERGRALDGDPNGLVASLLSMPGFIERLDAPFAGSPYAVLAVSVEKVLVGDAEERVPEAALGRQRVPYDAQLWIVLGSRR